MFEYKSKLCQIGLTQVPREEERAGKSEGEGDLMWKV
jgi:hypothetical protein